MKKTDVQREINSMTENRMNEHIKLQRGLSIASIAADPARMRARCDALVVAMLGKELADKWWTGPNKAFGDDTPEQMYSVAPSAVYAYLMKCAEGEW